MNKARRAMTMLETLVSLALLSGLALGLISLTSGSARTAALGADAARSTAAADRTLAAIADDLASWDERLRPNTRDWTRVHVTGETLRIATRNEYGARVDVNFSLTNASIRRHVVTTGRALASAAESTPPPLLSGVSEVSFVVADHRSSLTVTIVAANNATIERTFAIDPLDVEVEP